MCQIYTMYDSDIRNLCGKNCSVCISSQEIIILIRSLGASYTPFFKYKDTVPKELRSNVVYKYTCPQCSGTYVGETSRHLKTRIAEHRGVSARTGRQMCNVRSNIFQHRVDTGHTVTPDAFEVLHSGSENIKLTESILIHSLKPSLNTNLYSTPLNVLL